MRKVVSMNDGYSYFFDNEEFNDIDCVAYETNEHMSGQEIGNIFNVSRNAIALTLKRAVKKIYFYIKRNTKEISTLEILCIMASMFNIKTESEYKKFFRLFPKEIRGKFYEEAKRVGYTN